MDRPRYLVWHPSVHAQFGDELIFAFLKVTAFPREDVYNRIEKYLEVTRHTAYRVYRVLGTVDVILRVWVARGCGDDFMANLQRQVEYVESFVYLTVAEIPHHWHYYRMPKMASLNNLTEELVTSLQNCFGKPETWEMRPVVEALASSCVRPVTDTVGAIMFFTGLPLSGAHRFDLGYILKEIYLLFEQFKEGLHKTAVYRTRGEYAFLIKCETMDFFLIGAFIKELSHKIAGHKCGTVTSVVCDCQIRGREEIGIRSFRQVERRDIAASNILPELYDDANVTANIRAEVESWIRNYLVPSRPNITEEDFKAIQACLRAVITGNEEAFLSKIVEVFGRAERNLRSSMGKFIGKAIGPKEFHRTFVDALKHIPGSDQKKMDLIAIGDRLTVFAHAIKQSKLSEDPEIIGDWGGEASLRDRAAHFVEETFSGWNSELALLLRFCGRYKKLIELVENTCKD